MKKLLALTLTVLMTSSFAFGSVVFKVEGEIKVDEYENTIGPIVHLISEGQVLELSNTPEELMGCKIGVFEVVSNYIPENTYTVLNIIQCLEFEEDHFYGCPKIFNPVCGQPQMPECPEGRFCPMVMPAPRTYGNKCELLNEGAEFLKEGSCEA